MDEESTSPAPRVIVAKPSNDYRLRRYALVILMFGWGVYSIYDGFYHYPRDNSEAKAKGLEALPHPGYDVQFNQAFGILLPPASIALLIFAIYASRGQYEFDGTYLSVPGHPKITLADIREIDRSKWDRKGIALLHYETPDLKKGVIKLDDFIYQRGPTDEIYKQIETTIEAMNTPVENAPGINPET